VRIHRKLRQTFFVAMLVVCSVELGQAQQQNAPSLSPVLRTSFYPEAMCPHCIVPTWDQHYLLHREIDKDPSLVTMYDRDGKKIIEGRVSLEGASRISLRAAGATQGGHIVAVGRAAMTDGSIQHFIAEIGATGRTVQSIQLGEFSPQQVCAASDGTVWTLGYDWRSRNSAEAATNVVRHYDFAKGLLGRYLPLGSISTAKDAFLLLDSPHKSFLRCGKDDVSVLFWSSHTVAQYVVLNGASEEVHSWTIIAPFAEAQANGFAVTDDGGVFVSLTAWEEPENMVRLGLYKLQATTGNAAATLIPVGGTVTAVKPHDALPDDAFLEVYGAEGDELVVQRAGGWGLSWVRVSTSVSSPSVS
jgi:hypothetical protein